MPKPVELIQKFVASIAGGLGICHIVLACLTIVVGIAIITLKCYGWMLGVGIWVGIAFLITGCLAVAIKYNKKPRGLAQALLAMSVVSFLLALFLAAYGWYASTQEYFSMFCNEEFLKAENQDNQDYDCISESSRMAVDISLVVIAFFEIEVCLLSGALAYIMLAGPAIGPFDSITGLPFGKEREKQFNRPRKESTTSSHSQSYVDEEAPISTVETKYVEDPQLTSESHYDPDPLYSTADEVVGENSAAIALTTFSEPPPSSHEGDVPEYATVNKKQSPTPLYHEPPITTTTVSNASAPVPQQATYVSSEEPTTPPVVDDEDDDDEDDDEFAEPLLPLRGHQRKGTLPPLRPTMEVVRQSLLLKADSSSDDETPSGETSPSSHSTGSSRSETAPKKKKVPTAALR